MKFSISKELIEKFPDIKIGLIIAHGIDNKGKDEEIEAILRKIKASVINEFNAATLIDNEKISAWRKAYSSFGSKPSDYRPSIEALIRSVLKDRLRPINKLVNLYNFISLKYVIPAGGEDLDKINGDITLKFADGNETFVPLNSETIEKPYPREVIYCDSGNNVLCRRWNWRESEKTKLTEDTKNAIMVLESFWEISAPLEELELLIKKFCSAETKRFVVDKDMSVVEW